MNINTMNIETVRIPEFLINGKLKTREQIISIYKRPYNRKIKDIGFNSFYSGGLSVNFPEFLPFSRIKAYIQDYVLHFNNLNCYSINT